MEVKYGRKNKFFQSSDKSCGRNFPLEWGFFIMEEKVIIVNEKNFDKLKKEFLEIY